MDSVEPTNSKNLDVVHDVECDLTHKGRQLVNPTLPIDIETVFCSMFQTSKFFIDFHNSRNTTNLIQGEWEDLSDGTKKRVTSMTVALNQVIGPKTMDVTETQIMRSCSIPGQLYSIDATSVNKGIPYADSFVVLLHYCMKKTVGDCTVMSVHAEIEYKKKMWGVIKTFIEKNTWAILKEYSESLAEALIAESGSSRLESSGSMVLDLNDEGENSKADKNTEDVTVEAVSSILGAIGVKNPKVHSLLSVPFLIIKGKKKG